MNLIEKLLFGVVVGIFAMALIAIVGIIGAIPTYFLWNWLVPDIFGLPVITFWQAWGIFFLSGVLLKNNSASSKSSKSDE